MSKLIQIAGDMRRMIERTDARFVHRKLSGGLEIVLERRDDRWRLALGRLDRFPSDTEMAVCLAAFNAPEDATPHQVVRNRPGKTDGLRYHVVETSWIEIKETEYAA